MQVTLDIPEAVAAQILATGKNPSQITLQAPTIEGYRSESLSEEEVRRMPDLATRRQVHGILKQHGTPLHSSVEDL